MEAVCRLLTGHDTVSACLVHKVAFPLVKRCRDWLLVLTSVSLPGQETSLVLCSCLGGSTLRTAHPWYEYKVT